LLCCIIVVPFPPNKNPFAVQLNTDNGNKFSKHDNHYVDLCIQYSACTDHIFIVNYDHVLLVYLVYLASVNRTEMCWESEMFQSTPSHCNIGFLQLNEIFLELLTGMEVTAYRVWFLTYETGIVQISFRPRNVNILHYHLEV
jgi:hypothetical protein